MADFQTQIDRLVADFVAEVTDLARRAAITTLAGALGSPNGAQRHRVPGRGGKRSPEDLDGLRSQVLAFVLKNPGLRIEQINQQLGTKTKELALPMRKLISEGAIKTKGKKRSTAYFAK